MAKKQDTSDYFKRLMNQLSGEEIDKEYELIPEYCIVGSGGYIWCFDPTTKMMVRVARGTKAYILAEKYDYKGRNLVYTTDGLTICIDPDELILTECD
jgi:hypothetical protein